MDAYLKSLSIQKAISTLDQIFDARAREENPNGIIFVQEDGTDLFEPYPDLYTHAKRILGSLQNRGVKKGSYVIFQMIENRSFVRLFWACILGGIIPVPLSVPVTASSDTEAFKKMIKVAEQLQEVSIVSEGVILDNFQSIYKENKFVFFSYEELDEGSYQGQCVAMDPRDIGYIQYSSGSTGDPKGVVLTHEKLAFNVSQLSDRLNFQGNDVTGSWMPLTHDMGLIALHLAPMLAGMTHFFLSPNLFIKKPWLYLQKLCQHNATVTGSPNFGLDWMIEKTKESHLENMDLSKIRILLCGAEPISMDIIRKFYVKFSACGLRDKTIYQSYGMAEACVGVTIPLEGHNNESVLINRHYSRTGQNVEYVAADNPDAAEFAVLGQPLNGMEIAVVDEHDNLLQENQIGNIVIKGPNVFDGYIHQTSPPFTKQGFFHTGDSGFIRDGQLIIAGRKKDILFVNGQNYYASDIENMLSSALPPQHSQTVVCGYHGKAATRDEIIVFVRYRGKLETFPLLSRKIQETVFERVGIGIDHIIPIKNIPKTTSGKVQRYRLLEQFEQHGFDEILEKTLNHEDRKYIAPRTPEEKKVVEAFESVLNVERVSITDRIIDLGGDSLKITWLCNELEKTTGVRIPLKDIFSLTPWQITERIKHSQRDDLPESNIFTEILKIPKAESYPMSSAQKRLYILDELMGPNITYNIPGVIHIKNSQFKKKINERQLQKALDKLLEQEEILRTSFHHEGGQLVQKIASCARVLLETSKYTTEDAIDIQTEYKKFVRPFDLSKAPLMRVKLIRTPKDAYLLTDIHHIISDGISQPILLHRVQGLYEGRDLPVPFIQYKDYSAWQKSRDISDQAEYWKNEFSGGVPILDLRTDYPRSQAQSYRGSTIQVTMGEEASTKVRNLAKEHGVTEFMIMLAALFILLSKYSRQEEIIVGTPISGRTHVDTENMLGMFVNTLAIKGEVCSDDSFEILLNNIKEKCLHAYDNQDYPFEDLVEAIEVRRDFSRNPIFDIMFVLRENEGAEGIFNGIWTPVEVGITKFDLTLTAIPSPKGYTIHLQYCLDLFKEETIKQLGRHYTNLINAITKNPKRKIKEFPVIDTAEEEKVLLEFNTTDTEYPRDKTIVQLFEEQVLRTPRNTAVVFEGQEQADIFRLSYKELNARANSLARKLRQECKIQPDDFVAILTERSLEMIIGIFAILKSGAAYVPIDPTYPEERIRFMMEDCQPKALLVGPGGMGISAEMALHEMTVDLCNMDSYTESDRNLEHINSPENLAYLIYTSGTTGKPKGVMVEQRGVNNHLNIFAKKLNIGPGNAIGMFHNYIFDATVSEIMTALLTGARLVVLNQNQVHNTNELNTVIQKQKIDIITLPPQYAVHVRTNTIKTLITAGSEAQPEILKNINGCYINAYGPTEDTICTTYWESQKGEEQLKKIPIGKPASNTKVYILNGTELCGIGMPGELCITGDGIARGYLNQPELTARKFVGNPFGKGRMYCTGDLARWLPDGNIEFLGRIDEQIKIRGYRIEPGEIESCLLAYPGISAAVVIDREDHAGEKYLCAYITVEGCQLSEENKRAEDIKNNLRKSLPEYMVPTYIVQLDVIPLTRNGKLDKAALPIPQYRTGEYLAPHNTKEKQVTELFETILGHERVSVTDNFFNLGGHSLKATILANDLEHITGVRLPLKDIFSLGTPRKIAEKIRASKAGVCSDIPRIPEAESYPMSSAQKRLYILDGLMGPNITYNIPGVIHIKNSQPTEKMSKKKLQKALDELIKQEETLRTSFHHESGELLQKVAPDARILLETSKYIETHMIDIQTEYKNFIRPFDLSKAPLMRVKLVQTLEDTYLFTDTHHIISDGISQTIMLERIQTLCEGQPLLPQRVQYKDYSVWQNTRDIGSQAAYWKKEFAGEIPVLDLRTDYPRPQGQSYRGSNIQRTMEGIRAEVQKIAQAYGVTEFMIMLVVFMILLGKYSRQTEIIVGTPISGRTHADIANMLGMFVNTLAIKGDIRPDKSFETLLHSIREKCLDAYDNQEYPFEDLVEAVDIRWDFSRNPIFDIMFILQETNINNGKVINETEPIEGVSKFDLTLTVATTSEGYDINFEYCTDLFKPETIEQMARHYINLIKTILENPEQKIKELRMADAVEEETIQKEFNTTNTKYPQEKTIIQLFEEQVTRTPNNIAVVFEDRKLTYKELNDQANRLARKLRQEYKIQPDDFVAILTERSIEMIIGIYAILKSGAAYVPIDPTYPQERIEFILEDSQAKAVLVGPGKFRIPVDTLVVNLCNARSYDGNNENLKHINTPENLVYLVYTSGTTGKPKGVMVEHQNIVNQQLWTQREYPLTEEDALLMKTTCVFDVFAWEVFWWILGGSKIVILPQGEESDSEKITKLIQREQVTAIQFVPSMFNVFLDYLKTSKEQITTLRYIINIGEKLNPESVCLYNHLRTKGQVEAKLLNLYGPAETTVNSSYYDCPTDLAINKIFIGRPISNTQIYILENGRITGMGIPGELCIAGDGVARGYLNRPELTAEKFVPNPFGEGRMYRTGDLARWLPDGNIEYLGRIDDQVKIRGYRIEPGEIESRLLEQPDISAAAVIAREDKTGEKYLCAYIVANKDRETKIEAEAIKAELRKVLPDYMVPAQIIRLDNIPVTRNGKLDKAALPAPKYKAKKYTAPRDGTENMILEIWKDILGFEEIGIHDNFFELGGNSLKAMRVVSKLAVNYKINANDMFENPTIAALAEKLNKVNLINKIEELIKSENENATQLNTDTIDELKQHIAYHKTNLKKYNKVKLNKVKEYKNIMLCGVTGYLGIYMMRELLKNTSSNISLLVRGENTKKATERLVRKITFYFGRDLYPKYSHRITVINGDISKEHLGLSKDEYAVLANTIDCIINAAANVKHYGKYDEFHLANVVGTQHLLDLSMCGNPKDYHHISTLSVASGNIQNKQKVLFTEYDYDMGQKSDNYYIRTKQESEALVLKARDQGVRCTIFRVGNLVFDSESGQFQENIEDNNFYNTIRSYIKLAAFPMAEEVAFDLSYIDYVSKAIMMLFNREQLENETHHIFNPDRVNIFKYGVLLKEIDSNIKLLEPVDFINYLKDKYNSADYSASIENILFQYAIRQNSQTQFNITGEKTNLLLRRMGFQWPKLTKQYLHKMIEYCKKVKYIA